MRSTPDTRSRRITAVAPGQRLGARLAVVAVAVALTPGAFAVSASQAAGKSAGPVAVASKKKPKKCKRGFKLNKHGKCVSSSSPVY